MTLFEFYETMDIDTLKTESDLVEYIESLIENGESCDIEFKSAQGGFPSSFWDTYSSFANTYGGIIVLGVKERDNKCIVEGLSTDQIIKYKREFWNSVNNPQVISANIVKESDVIIAPYHEKQLLLISVRRAERTQKPVYRTTHPFAGNTFKRNNDGDYKCSDVEVKRMMADSDDSHPQDSRILSNYTIEDIDIESLRQYRQLLSVSRHNHPWLSKEDLPLLESLGGYRKDRSLNIEGYTVAGLLMFGKYKSIVDQECVPGYFPDYREKLTSDPDVRWTDRIYPDGTWEANLFQFYLRVFNKMSSMLPKPFRLKETVRIDDSPTHIALREAFVNLLIHASYTCDGNIVIDNSINKITFSNPGSLLISRSQYYQGGISICRNKSLQKMFMMIGRAERAGSGVDKILDGWKQANFRRPYVEECTSPDRVVLKLPMVSLLPEETINTIKINFGNDITQKITHNQMIVLATCCTETDITNDILQCLIEEHSVDITKLLKDLCRGGYLVSHGSGRGTKYNINRNYLSNDDLFAEIVPGYVDSSTPNVDSSTPNVDSSTPNVDSSTPNVDSSTPNVDSFFTARKRLSPTELDELVTSVAVNYVSLDELSVLIRRDVKYLKNKIIPRMIECSKLERLFPDIPKHPQQKYRVKQ